MVSKEQVKSLIEDIKKAKGMSQEQISTALGFKPKTLTQMLSSGDSLESLADTLKRFRDGLSNSTKEIELLRELLLEKNSHLQTMEENKREWAETSRKLIDQNNRLLTLLEAGLNGLGTQVSEGNRVLAAFQHFWIDQWAEKRALVPGEKRKAEEIASDARIKVSEYLGGKQDSDSPSVEGMLGMQGSRTS